MPELGAGLLGCYRCGYVWRLRKSPVRMCPRCKSRGWNRPPPSSAAIPATAKGRGIDQVIGSRRAELLALAAEYGATNLRVFGSVARGEARSNSDVDLLVHFRKPIGLLARMEFKARVAHLLHRRVDLSTPESLHWLIRPAALAEAVVL